MTLKGLFHLNKIFTSIGFLLLLLSSPSPIHAQSERLDSLINMVKSNKCGADSTVTRLFETAYFHCQKEKYTKGLADVHKQYGLHLKCLSQFLKADSINRVAITFAEKIGDDKFLATIYNNNIGVLSSQGRHKESVQFGKKALALLGPDQDPLYVVNINQNMVEPYVRMGAMDSATMCAIAAQKSAETTSDKALLAKATSALGLIYYKREMFPEAIKLISEAATLSLSIGDTMTYANETYRLGGLHRANEDFDQAETSILTAISIFERYQSNYYLVYAYSGIGDVYYQKNQIDRAIEFNNKAYSMAAKANMKDLEGVSLGNIGSAYLKAGKSRQAITYFEQAIAILEAIESKELLLDCYKQYASALSQSGDSKKALEVFQKYHETEKELYNAEKSKDVAELQTKYETEKKEAEIATLSQQAAIQELKIAQRNQTIIIGLVGFVLIFLVVYFIYRERTIKKDRVQTELEHRFLRSQLNPHFIFNALLAIQNFMLKNDGKAAALYLTKFSKLMRQILESSREEFIPVEEEIEMLKNYMDIHQLRLQNSFSYSIEIASNIDPETDTIPPMFVQPFVENAIEHGIVNAKEKGRIELSLKKVAGYITIELKDNGGGLSGGSSDPKDHNSLATTIIKERMELFNKSLKDQIQLILGDIRGENGEILGTKVELKVPFGYI